MKRLVHKILEGNNEGFFLNYIYEVIRFVLVIASLVPLMVVSETVEMVRMDHAITIFFVLDYIVRWWVSDITMKVDRKTSLVEYPLTPLALLDLIALLPVLLQIGPLFEVLRGLRAVRILRLVRLKKYSKSFDIVQRVFRREMNKIGMLFGIAILLVYCAALVVFQVENAVQPDVYKNFFDAMWWAFATVTTLGYGDVYPITVIGRLVSIGLSFLGVVLIAVPSGIITAGFMEEMNNNKKKL